MSSQPTAGVRNLDRALTQMHNARADLRFAIEHNQFSHGCDTHVRFEWSLVVLLDELRPLVTRADDGVAELWDAANLDAIKRNAGRPEKRAVEAAGRTNATTMEHRPSHIDATRLLEAAGITDEIVADLGLGPDIETNPEWEIGYEQDTDPSQ